MSGKEGYERGHRHEALALELLKEDPMPFWMISVRQATVKEDHHNKVDIIIETNNVGTIPLQIKSSKNEVKRFRKKHKKIPVVRVEEKESKDSNKVRLLEVIEKAILNKFIESYLVL